MRALVERIRTALERHREVSLAILFGSVARGQETAGSDIDIAVRGDVDRFALGAELSRDLGREVDVVPLDTDDLILLSEVVRDGEVALERVPGSYARFRSRALATLELDLPSIRRQQAAFVERLASSGVPDIAGKR